MESKIVANGFKNVKRLGGKDRYETAAKIAEELDVKSGTSIVIASGENYPDALSVSSPAAIKQYPVLLVTKDGISDSVKKEISAINPGKIFIIGLQGAIKSVVESQLAQIIPINKTNIVRVGGSDRFQTSVETAKYFDLPGDIICVTTGNDFPDALVGSMYAAKNKAPIILTGKSLSDYEMAYIMSRKISGAAVFGGENAVNKDIIKQLSRLINQ